MKPSEQGTLMLNKNYAGYTKITRVSGFGLRIFRVWRLGVWGLGLCGPIWDFPKIWVPYFGVLIIRIILFRVLYSGPLFFGNPI